LASLTPKLTHSKECYVLIPSQPRSMSIKCTTRRQELRTYMGTTACQWPRLHNHLRTRTRTLACQWLRLRLHLHPLPKSTFYLAGVPAAVAHVRDGQESAGSFSSSSCWLLCWSWWWPWSSLSQYKMAKTDRDMVDKSVQENALEGGRVI
jgi:hypothetical protein